MTNFRHNIDPNKNGSFLTKKYSTYLTQGFKLSIIFNYTHDVLHLDLYEICSLFEFKYEFILVISLSNLSFASDIQM